MKRPWDKRRSLSVVDVGEAGEPSNEPRPTAGRRIDNPPNPFLADERSWLEGMEPPVAIEVFEDQSRSILAHNDSPDIGFSHSVNPYRGCQHACAYCYARPTHEYLSLGAGTDFDTKIHVKLRAAELLTEAFEKPSWRGETVVFSGVTDCYQPLEASYRLTRACLAVCARYQNPVGIVTKSALIERDIDVLRELAAVARLGVSISIPFFDEQKARAIEPFVPSAARRLRIIETLADAGIDVGVMTAPIIPGLNDEDMPRVLEAAARAGARHAGYVLVRLPGSVAGVFEHRLRAAFPERADKIMSRIVQTRGGNALYDSRFGTRQTGSGAMAQVIGSLFLTTARRVGLAPIAGEPAGAVDQTSPVPSRAHDGSLWSGEPTTFKRPDRRRQLALF
jgi:DNA repair photolyase